MGEAATQTILQVVYFYNPLLWLANATIRRVRELAVDEAVLVILGKSTSEVYPRTLLKVAGWALDQPKHGLGLIGVMESNHLLTERIKIMLQKPIPHSKKIGIIGLGTLFVLGVFLLPMARGAGIQTAPTEIAESNAEAAKDADESREIAASNAKKAKEAAEIKAMKAEIESLQKTIRMKLDELRKKETELKLMQHVLNAKMDALGLVETTPYSPGIAPAAVAPSEAGLSPARSRGKQPSGGMMMAAVAPSEAGLSPARSRGKQPGGWVAIRSNGPGEPSATPSGAVPSSEQPPGVGGMRFAAVPGSSSAGSRGKRPGGGMMMTVEAGSSSAGSRGKRPSGGMMMAAVPMPAEPDAKPSGVGSSSVPPPPVKRPSGGMMMGAAMPGELGVEQDSVLVEDALPENISDEVRKELLRILPGLLREMLPKLLKEAQSKTVESPSLIEQF
jgi:hypothetical protein